MHAQCVKNTGALCDMGKHSRMILSMNDVDMNPRRQYLTTYNYLPKSHGRTLSSV